MEIAARHRIELGGLAAVVVAAVTAPLLAWQASVLLAWDGAVVVFGTLVWATVLTMDPGRTRQHALLELPGLRTIHSFIVGAAVACLGAVGLILVKASSSHGSTKALFILVGIVSVLLSWALVHTIYTLRYARLYYLDPEGGVDFKDSGPPDYKDFAYLSFTIGMTFQVSDTDLMFRRVRRAALGHALLSYLFGAVVIGLVINILASLLQT